MRIAFSRLVSALICLSVLALLPLPQYAVLTLAESSEMECPLQEEGEKPQEELVVKSPVRRRSNDRLQSGYHRSRKASCCFQHGTFYDVRLPVIVGHQLANGLSAPLLI